MKVFEKISRRRKAMLKFTLHVLKDISSRFLLVIWIPKNVSFRESYFDENINFLWCNVNRWRGNMWSKSFSVSWSKNLILFLDVREIEKLLHGDEIDCNELVNHKENL